MGTRAGTLINGRWSGPHGEGHFEARRVEYRPILQPPPAPPPAPPSVAEAMLAMTAELGGTVAPPAAGDGSVALEDAWHYLEAAIRAREGNFGQEIRYLAAELGAASTVRRRPHSCGLGSR